MPGLSRRAQGIRVVERLAIAAVLAGSSVTACHVDNVTAPGFEDAGALLAVRGDSLLFLNDSAQYSAEIPGAPQLGPRKIDWTSSDSTIVSVDERGMVRARRIGTATLVVTLTAPDLVAPLTRSQPVRVTYAAIAVDPVDSLTGLGERRALLVRGLDVFGTPDAVLPAILASRDTTILSVVGVGEIEARGEGVTRIVATSGGHRDSIPVRVRRVAGRLSFGVSTVVLPSVGRDTVVPLHVRDTNDSLMVARSIRWTSADPTAIAVNADGTFRALRAAPGSLTAQVDTVAATLGVTVSQIVATLDVRSGDAQVRTVGSAVSIPPSVVVRDGGGYPIGGVEVVFSVGEGGGTVTDPIQTTGADGIATVGGWTLGPSPGANRLLAQAGGVVAAISATAATGSVDPATSVIAVAGDRVEAGGTTVITLRGRDAFGNPVTTGGAAVTFHASGGTSTGHVGGTIDVGDGTYTTTFTGLTAGSPTTIGATLNGAAVTSAEPTITVVPGAPARLALTDGDAQQATVGTAVPVAPAVALADAVGNPIPGAVVTFAVTGGGGSVTRGTQVTDSAGRARVGAWTLGPTAGEQLLTAVADTARATFTATAMSGPVSPTASLVVIPQDTVAVGEGVGVLLQTYDAFGNVAVTGGATVTFFLEGGTSGGTFASTVDRGDGTYVAAFTAVTPGTPAFVRAIVGGVAVTTPSPTLTVRGRGVRWQ